MRIVFLCSSLEPGRDGVGDYVRRLAAELLQRGQQVTGIALNEQIPEEIASAPTAAPDVFSTLRLPAAWPVRQRFARAQEWIEAFDAEWLSLQFVPFGFHPKGLPFGLAAQLAQLGKGRAWHLMMHELWVGMDEAATTKHVWWGRVQRLIISRLIKRLKPKMIHTQTTVYQAQLAKIGFSSQYLPLFSNIPNAGAGVHLPASGQPHAAAVNVVVFGTIHPGAPIAALAQDAARYALSHQAVVTLLMVGRCGSEQDHWAATWEAAGLPVVVLGEQTPAQISQVLLEATLGLATTPAFLLGKSGTAAAMQEHGLPILCLSAPWVPRGLGHLTPPDGVAIYEEGNFEAYLARRAEAKYPNRAANVANQLIDSLLNS